MEKIKCDFCKEVLKGRVDIHNDLSLVDAEEDQGQAYYCRKVMVGSNRCYRPIEVKFTFDTNRKLKHRQIVGGEFVGEEDYLKI